MFVPLTYRFLSVRRITFRDDQSLSQIRLAGSPRGTGGVNFQLFDGDGTQPGARLLTSEYLAFETLPNSLGAAVANPLFIDLSGLRYRVAPGQLFSFAVGPANPLDEPGTVGLVTGSGPAGATPLSN